VTVNANGFSLGTVSIKPWNDVEDDEDVGMSYVMPSPEIIDEKANVRKYDYLLSDGTFWRVPKACLAEITDEQKEKIVGVVFWTEAENAEDCPGFGDDNSELSAMGCTHGLVVSLNKYSTKWMDSKTLVGVTETDIEKLNGYKNTVALRNYNNTNQSAPVLAVSVFADETNIKNTSGWYLPSTREVVYMWGGTTLSQRDGDNELSFTEDLSTLNKYLTTIRGTTGIENGEHYWTSCEISSNDAHIINMYMDMYPCVFETDKTYTFHSRPICAF
jgi:hypothetical protein